MPEHFEEECSVLVNSKCFLETLWQLVDLRINEHRLLNFIKRSESNLWVTQDTNDLHQHFSRILENQLFEQAVRRRIDYLCRNQGYEDRQDLYNSTMVKVYRILLEQHANLCAPGSFRYSAQHPSIIAFASQVAWGVVKDEAKHWSRQTRYIISTKKDISEDDHAAQWMDHQPTLRQSLPETRGILIEDRELQGFLSQWLQNLSRTERNILKMMGTGQSCVEIARQMNWAADNVLRYLRRIRDKFRAFLEQHFGDSWRESFERFARLPMVQRVIAMWPVRVGVI